MNDVEVEVPEHPGNLERERVLVPHPAMAHPVEESDGVPGRGQGDPEVREDSLDRPVARRRDGLDPPSDEDDPHALPTFALD